MGVGSASTRKRSRSQIDGEADTSAGLDKCSELFQGCHFLFLQPLHMQRMMERIRQFGGEIHSSVTHDITHIIAKSSASKDQIAAKLLGGPLAREAPSGPGSAASLQLSPGVHVVTPDFVAHSILQQQRQPETSFLPASLQPRPTPATTPADVAPHSPPPQPPPHTPQGSPQQQPSQQQGQPEAHAPPGKGPAHGYPQHTPPPGAWRCPQGEGAEQIGRETSDAGAGSREHSTAQGTGRAEYAAQAAGSGGGEEGCVVERRGAEFVCVQGRLPQFTGGSTSLPWGSFGVWEEPWEEAAARETVDKLKNFWYQTGAHPLAVSAPPLSPQRNEPTNGVCGHAACAARPFCVVERLGAVKAVYVEGRDQFRIKAIERSLQQLVQHPTPLDTDRDVEGVGLGTKSAEKVKEILRRGVSSRVEAVEGDEERQVTSRFLQVWGVGPSTAARWYAAGCRTLGDLRGRGDLTEQQKVGLKYYEDIQQRIPRAESAAAQHVVREACFKLCEEWGARDVDRCFAAVTGSFIRGKPTSGDVDILICLPPSLTGADCGAFLTQLLCRLVGSGFLLDEMSPRQPHAASERRASWMGMCRPPGAPCNRRIDVKVYGAPTAAFAVNYFANSMSFCRATRHWANHAVPQEAAQYNPAATGFKISDAEMVPRRSASGRHRGRHRTEGPSSQDSGGEGGGEQLLWPAVPCRCESDIFNALQLAYVPPHMRFFHDYA